MQHWVVMRFIPIPLLIMTVHRWLILIPPAQAELNLHHLKALTVDLSASSTQNITVDYAVTGTATGSGTDYTLPMELLTISAGATTGTITIAGIVDDGLDEANETVIVTLSNPSNATLGSDDAHTYTITDNDNAPVVDFNTTSSNGAESSSSKAITVDLSAASSQNVTVDYAVTGTATGSGTDYTLCKWNPNHKCWINKRYHHYCKYRR